MLDDLREEASSSPFFEDEAEDPAEFAAPPRPRASRLLGMTASQRFFIAIMILLMVCILGSFCLMVFNKVNLPF